MDETVNIEKKKFTCRLCGNVFWSGRGLPVCSKCGEIVCLSEEGEW